jgi:hypothetical protein
MRRLTRNIFLQCLMVLALVTAGVSPACAFIAGKMTMIEICGADGLMKISVPAENAPDSGHQQHDQQFDCGFCIAHAAGKGLTTPDTAIIDFSHVYAEAFVFAVTDYQSAVLDGRLPARGPPAFL